MGKHTSFLILVVALIFATGLLMIFDTTAAEALTRRDELSEHSSLLKQLLYAGIGLGLGVVTYRLGAERILAWSPQLFILSTLLLILVFIPKVGQQINGANRWIGVGSITFQPSEFAKFAIPLFFIHRISKFEGRPIALKEFLKLLSVLMAPLFLILIEPDNGTVVMIGVALTALFFLSKIRWIYWVLPICALCVVGAGFALHMSHVPDRIRVYLNPELDLRGKGHQPHQARIAAGSGRLLGRGIGSSMQKLDYLPEARSDYIAAIFAEEFGFVGVVALVTLYTCLGYLGFYLAAQCKDASVFYLLSMLTLMICFQAFLNLGVVCGLLPSKGTNLPFFSQGGSSLISNLIALSILISPKNFAHKATPLHTARKRLIT